MIPTECTAVGADAVAKFLGSDPTDPEYYSLANEYNSYVAEYQRDSTQFTTMTMTQLWEDPGIIRSYPRLAPLGRWYAAYVASSVAAERAFGVMRGIDIPNRNRMSETTFKHQMISRYDRARTTTVVREVITKATPPSATTGLPALPTDLPVPPAASADDDDD